jgi:hypothetical protein
MKTVKAFPMMEQKNKEGNINIDTAVSALYKASGWP